MLELSSLMDKLVTPLVCYLSVSSRCPVFRSHTIAVLSQEPETMKALL